MNIQVAEDKPRKKEVTFQLACSGPYGTIYKFLIDGIPFQHVGSVSEGNDVVRQFHNIGVLDENERFELARQVQSAEFSYSDTQTAPAQFRTLLKEFRSQDYRRGSVEKANLAEVAFPDARENRLSG